eukprot:991703_1
MSSYVCVMFQHTVTAILHRPQNDLFLQSDYWSAFASTAYLIHSKNHKTFTPNKSKADLQSNSKYQTDNSIHEMSELLLLMIDEYILIYSQPTSFNKIESTQIVDYCWKYLLKKDATIHDQIRTMLSKNKALSKMHKNLVLVLYCQIRALFRKNSAIFQFKKENLPKYICERIRYIHQETQRKRKYNIQDRITLMRAQLNHIFIPLFKCGFRNATMQWYEIGCHETMLCWFARLYCDNKQCSVYETELETMKETIQMYENDRKEVVSPYLKRTNNNAYTAEFAQHVVHVRSETKTPKSRFRDTANEFMSFVSPVAHKWGAVPKFPCGNTIKTMEEIVRQDFIDNAKHKVFSKGMPCTLSSDGVKKTGCLGKKK